MDTNILRIIMAIGFVFLFVFSSVIGIPIKYNEKTTTMSSDVLTNKNFASASDDFNMHYFPEYVAKEKYPNLYYQKKTNLISKNEIVAYSNNGCKTTLNENMKEKTIQLLNGPIDSPWPMHGHDVHHTGCSPYTTVNNIGFEKWKFVSIGFADSDPVINTNGVIYVGSWFLYAIYPNGTSKWKCDTSMVITSGPAIDENGVLYIGTIWAMPNYLYAIYTSNGTLKWKYQVGDDITSSPAIGDDGCIYFGDWNGNIHAVYPNGTRKWIYHTDDVVTSSPAIGFDGTIYCGSHDNYVYAFNPDNGTVRWKFNTGSWVHGIPTIGPDGTIYIGSDNGYLYAFYPNNGTLKWQCSVGSTSVSPALDEDGILYFGVWEGKFYAVYPNGTIKWSFDLGSQNGVWGSSAAISADGTIYFGMCYDMGTGSDGDIIALNPDGSEKWRRGIGRCHSSPAIGEDGTVYISNHGNNGHIFAFGYPDPNAPTAPQIDGQANGKAGTSYDYTFESTSPLERNVYYYIDWNDGNIENWIGPYASGETVTVSHTYGNKGTYTISARAKDTDNLWGPWGTMYVTMPLDLNLIKSSSQQIIQQHSSQMFFQMIQRLLNIR